MKKQSRIVNGENNLNHHNNVSNLFENLLADQGLKVTHLRIAILQFHATEAQSTHLIQNKLRSYLLIIMTNAQAASKDTSLNLVSKFQRIIHSLEFRIKITCL